ncbi:hypothetical protein DVR12_15680 [Chitinophaga silvatica]|uniref:FAR-17a/AIG1-like protein n=1 Tax=Chitinophaga silvatica TaxID=2282649 RepID=A0A3E1Y827_9BACT|nr:Pr6Pr family membrane protein [Chitinophaga silvatica]RFS21341.1 hypothetical protein DVR12_15680 [Chitinophaga silvatica]
MNKQSLQQIILIILSFGGWFALIAQFVIMMGNKEVPTYELVIRFFSFFTILTNILLAINSTTLLLIPKSGIGKWFAKPQVATALTVYILIVSLVYNIVLRSLWHPIGLQKIVDELLHTVLPILFVLYWIYFVPKNTLCYKYLWSFLLYPLGYIIYVLIRGTISGFYPYPFLNVVDQGWNATIVAIIVLAFVFILFSLIFLAIAKQLTKRGQP